LIQQIFIALSKHIVAGAEFAANIVTDFKLGCFDVPANIKSLPHLWSLGVEESGVTGLQI
jgi:peptidoglycan/LPS O-acetylase OafA/YrhL